MIADRVWWGISVCMRATVWCWVTRRDRQIYHNQACMRVGSTMDGFGWCPPLWRVLSRLEPRLCLSVGALSVHTQDANQSLCMLRARIKEALLRLCLTVCCCPCSFAVTHCSMHGLSPLHFITRRRHRGILHSWLPSGAEAGLQSVVGPA
jgi:hypothetical protein